MRAASAGESGLPRMWLSRVTVVSAPRTVRVPSGAKARGSLAGVMYGLKPVPFKSGPLMGGGAGARFVLSQVPEGEGPGPPAKGTGRAATKGGSLNCLIRLLLASQAVLQRLG